jgi:hypothetical protein
MPSNFYNTADANLQQPVKNPFGLQKPTEVSTTALLPLGTTTYTADGRAFVYGQAGGTELAYGLLAMTQATDANEQNETVATAAPVGSYEIGITTGGAVTANQFANGFLMINDANGEGQYYKIKSHPAGTANVIYTLYEPIRVAVTTSGKASLLEHPCAKLVISAATAGSPVGVPIVAIPAANYGWFQTRGVASVLVAGTIVIGQNAVQAAGGAVAPNAGDILPVVGTVLQVSANTEYAFINLDVPGFR